MSNADHDKVITGLDVRNYFQDSVQTAVHNQQLDIGDDTLVYIVNLLTDFTRSDRLYEDTTDGRMIKPLVKFYSEAVSAESWQDSNYALKRLGDIALFISGLFANSLQRSLVDVDYYIAMGGSAYDSLADSSRRSFHGHNFSDIYRELAEKFARLVDVLGEVGDEFQAGGNQDLLRLYEVWMLTGSPQAARKLRQLGIQPVTSADSKAQH